MINFSELSREQLQELNSLGKNYFLGREDFIKYLEAEVEEQESAKNARQEEDEKSAFSGRKSRKERRILKGILPSIFEKFLHYNSTQCFSLIFAEWLFSICTI